MCRENRTECVDKFSYLGSVTTKDGDVKTDVNTRLANAEAVFRKGNWIMCYKSCSLSMKIKLQLYSVVAVQDVSSELCQSVVTFDFDYVKRQA